MKKAIFAFLCLSSLMAAGQNTRWDNLASTTTGVGQMLPVLALPGAMVAFYTGCTTLPCATPAVTYESSSGTACPSNAQVVWQLPIAQGCVGVADSQGNFGGWFQPGVYQYVITVSGHASGPYEFNVAGAGGGVISITAGTGIQVSSGTGNVTVSATPNAYLLTTLSAGISSSATTIPLTSVAGLNNAGEIVIGSEWISYTGISGDSLTGATRGVHLTTPAAYSSSTNVYSVIADFTNPSQAPNSYMVTYGNGSTQFSVFNCSSPDFSQSLTAQFNCDADGLWITTGGAIEQLSSSQRNILESEVGIGPGGGLADITNSGYLFDSTRQNNSTVAQGFAAGIAPLVEAVQPPTIGAPAITNFAGFGSTTWSWECTGTDVDGNTFPGTVATITNGPASISSGEIIVQCPYSAGAVTESIWRTAGPGTTGFLHTAAMPASVDDIGGSASGTPPATNASVPKSCVGAGEVSCWITSASAPTGSCTNGWFDTNQSGSPATLYQCVGNSWAEAGGSGVASVNSGTGAITIAAGSNVTVSTTGSTVTIGTSGSAGSGSVAAGNQYLRATYPNSGSNATVAATPNEATLPSGLSSSQISSVLSGSNLAVTLQPGAAPVPFVNTNHNPIHDDNTVVPAEPWNMRASGAVCDAQFVTLSITQNSTTITTGGGNFFTSNMADGATWIETVGKDPSTSEPIRFDTTIASVTNATTAVLSGDAPFTSASGYFVVGHQDDSAIADAIGVGIASGRQVNAPNGTCWTSTPQRFGANIVGHGSILAGFGEAEQGTVFLGSAGEDVFQSSLAVGAAPAGMNSGNYTITLAPAIDATMPWEICSAAGSCTQQTPLYRPIGILGPDAQNPLAPQWIEGPNTAQYNTGAINGLAYVTNGSNSFTVPTGQTAPSVGETVVFPYLSTIFSGTVASVSGQTVTLGSGQNYTGSTWHMAGSSAITACSLSESGTTFTATFTATNSLSSGNVVGVSGLTSTTCKQLNGYAWTVLSSGLSSSQFEAQSANFTSGTTGSASDTGSFFLPFPAATEWFAGTSFQNIQTSIPATGRTFPMTIALGNPIAPSPAGFAGVAPFGYVQIDGEQCAYYGNSNYPASAASISTPTITLQGCAQNGTTAAAHSVGAIIVPLNPFEPTWPWPVTPTVMSGLQSPVDAEFFPAQGVGNAAISIPVPNGTDYASSIGLANGNLHDVLINIGGGAPATIAQGGQIQNDTAAMYMAVQPFGMTTQNITIRSTFYGIVEGAPSTNTDNYFRNGFPTADGNHWINIFDQSSALPMDIISEGSGMFTGLTFFSESFAPPNNYIPGWTPSGYPESGSQGNLMLDAPYDDQTSQYPYDGTGVQFTTFQFKYLEPETGFFNQTQPLDFWNCDYCTWINTTPKGSGVRFITGAFQQFYGGTLNINSTTPIVLMGTGINFEHVAGMGSSYLGTTYGSSAVLNWGPNNSAFGPGDNAAGTVGGPNIPQLGGDSVAPVLGQTDDTLATGNTAIPYVAARGLGYFSPEQMPPSTLDPGPMTGGWTFDPTSPISNSFVSCAGPSGYACTPTHMTGDYVIIGPGQRIVAGQYYGHVSFKTPNGATSFTFRLFAISNGSCTGTGGYSTTITTPDSGWHDYAIPLADFTGDTGCLFTPNFTNGSAAFDIQVGYLDLLPMPVNLRAQSLTTAPLTVSTLPSASSVAPGTMIVVSDGNGTPPTCTGSGTNYQIAISNGSAWSCH